MVYELNVLYEWINPKTNQKEILGKLNNYEILHGGGHGSIIKMMFIKENDENNTIKFVVAQGLPPIIINKIDLSVGQTQKISHNIILKKIF